MTQPHSDSPDQIGPDPDRKAIRNFTWTDEAISEWEDIWHDLWRLGYKWEWQNSDRYARRYGDTFKRFGVYNDALRLDMALPLPGVEVIHQIRENILDCSDEDQRYDHLVGKLSRWVDKHEDST
jgi:hypothetical protein